jgi:serine/threonine protein kinase
LFVCTSYPLSLMFYRLPLCLVLICGCDQGESLRKKALSVPDENRDAISKRGYVICEEVGQGGDARAFLVSKNCDEGTEKQIAKCSLRNEVEKFKDEFRIMNEIYVIDPLRFPKPIDLISIDNVSCIFMDRYGSDLEKKRRTHDTRFSLITIATIGLYMMDTLDKFHKAGYVHMDPHPGNWLFDFGPLNKKLRLIDFGHTKEVSIEGQWKDLFHLIIGLRFLEIGDDAYMYPWDMHAQRPGIHLCKNGVSREICDMLQVAAAPRDGDLQALEQDIRTRLLSILKSRGISYSDEIRW